MCMCIQLRRVRIHILPADILRRLCRCMAAQPTFHIYMYPHRGLSPPSSRRGDVVVPLHRCRIVVVVVVIVWWCIVAQFSARTHTRHTHRQGRILSRLGDGSGIHPSCAKSHRTSTLTCMWYTSLRICVLSKAHRNVDITYRIVTVSPFKLVAL